jgi:putative acetyltransferase
MNPDHTLHLPPAMTVRPYRAGDEKALLSLFRASVHSLASEDYSTAQLRAWAPDQMDEVAFAHRCASKTTFVAEVNGAIAGFSDFESDGHIDMLYVHPEFQRRGVARALLRHIESAAQGQGIRRLYTEASLTAQAAFLGAGFKLIVPQTVQVRGTELTNFRMEKRLAPSSAIDPSDE